jgi:hypothetical protein
MKAGVLVAYGLGLRSSRQLQGSRGGAPPASSGAEDSFFFCDRSRGFFDRTYGRTDPPCLLLLSTVRAAMARAPVVCPWGASTSPSSPSSPSSLPHGSWSLGARKCFATFLHARSIGRWRRSRCCWASEVQSPIILFLHLLHQWSNSELWRKKRVKSWIIPYIYLHIYVCIWAWEITSDLICAAPIYGFRKEHINKAKLGEQGEQCPYISNWYLYASLLLP